MLNVTIVGYLFEIVTSTAKRLSNSLIETIEEILLRAMKRVEKKVDVSLSIGCLMYIFQLHNENE
jgi:hypothetical protein